MIRAIVQAAFYVVAFLGPFILFTLMLEYSSSSWRAWALFGIVCAVYSTAVCGIWDRLERNKPCG